jgi:spermidine synthase
MVLGLASGITAGEVLYYPVERLDVVEISQQVVEASSFFVPWNNNVLSNPKTNLIIQDARAHLQLTKQKYDVIISEPSNPWMAGLATLFTRDFFELTKDRLNEEGMFVQWFHSYQLDWPTFALVGRTFAQVFPNSILVQISTSGIGHDYLFVGFKGKSKLALENVQHKLLCIKRSKNITLADPSLLYRLIVSEDLPRLFGPGPSNTDSRPRLEFAAPKLMYYRDPVILKNILSKKYLSPQTKNIVAHIITDIDAQIDFAVYALSVYSPFPNMVDTTKATPSQKERYFKIMETYYANNPIEDRSVFKSDELKQRCISAQINAIRTNIDRMPDKPFSYTYLALLYYGEGMLNEAVANLTKSLQLKPDDAENRYNLGLALQTQGKFDEAVSQYNQALQLNPNDTRTRYNLGNILQSAGRLDEAVSQYRKVLEVSPDDEKAHNNLALALQSQGRLDEATSHYRRALQIKPDFFEANYNLGAILSSQGKSGEAINYLREALRINPNDAEAHNSLAAILLEQGKLNEAIDHFRSALQIKPDYVEPLNRLAEILTTHPDRKVRDVNQAITLAERAADLTEHKDAAVLETFAKAYAAGGQFDKAVTIAETALKLASTARNNELAGRIRSQLEFYKQSKP